MADVTDEGFYVYGLIDPAIRRQTKDDLLSVFYVGKGKNERWRDHEQDERRDLRRELHLLTRGSKASGSARSSTAARISPESGFPVDTRTRKMPSSPKR